MTPKKRKEGVIGTGTLEDGKMTWDSPHALTAQLKELGNGRAICRIDLASESAIRSIKANRYYRFGLGLIAKDTGNDTDDLHDFYGELFLKRKAFLVNPKTGEVEEKELTGRSSQLGPEEFWEYTEKVRQHAAEFFNVNIPDPDPDYARKRRGRKAS